MILFFSDIALIRIFVLVWPYIACIWASKRIVTQLILLNTNFKTRFNRQRDRAEKGGRVAECLARWTCNLEAPSSSPALITCWICSRLSHVQILGHTCKIANWVASYQLGFLTMLCSIQIIICFKFLISNISHRLSLGKQWPAWQQSFLTPLPLPFYYRIKWRSTVLLQKWATKLNIPTANFTIQVNCLMRNSSSTNLLRKWREKVKIGTRSYLSLSNC